MNNTYFGLNVEMINKDTRYKFDIDKHKNFISHIEKNELECSKKSYGVKYFTSIKNDRLFSDNDIISVSSIVIVIPLKYFNKNISINNNELLKECIGHAYIFYDKSRDLIYISNLCIHQHVSKTQSAPKLSSLYKDSILMSDNKVLSSSNFTYNTLNTKIEPYIESYSPDTINVFSGWGTIFVESLLNSLIKYNFKTRLCLLVDIFNNSFEEATNLYIKFGFKNPFITNIDALGWDYGNILIGLTKKNEIENPSKEEREQVYTEILYILSENKRCFEKNDVCSLNMFLEEKLCLWLLRLPYATSNYTPNGSISQNSFSGAFVLDKVIFDSFYKWRLNIDYSDFDNEGSKILSNNFIKKLKDHSDVIKQAISTIGDYAIGGVYPSLLVEGISTLKTQFNSFKTKLDTVLNYSTTTKNLFILDKKNSVEGIINFTSHTYESIIANKVLSYPTGEDYVMLLESFILYGTISTFVITLNGIFVISFAKNICESNNIRILNKKFDNSESPETKNKLIQNIISKYTITSMGNSEIEYIKITNNVICDLIFTIPIFNCDFKSWEKLLNNEIISINYPQYNKQCYTNLPIKDIIKDIYTYQNITYDNINKDNIRY